MESLSSESDEAREHSVSKTPNKKTKKTEIAQRLSMYKSEGVISWGSDSQNQLYTAHCCLLLFLFSASLGEVNQFPTNNEARASSVHSWENDSKIRLLTTAGGSASLGVRRK